MYIPIVLQLGLLKLERLVLCCCGLRLIELLVPLMQSDHT